MVKLHLFVAAVTLIVLAHAVVVYRYRIVVMVVMMVVVIVVMVMVVLVLVFQSSVSRPAPCSIFLHMEVQSRAHGRWVGWVDYRALLLRRESRLQASIRQRANRTLWVDWRRRVG